LRTLWSNRVNDLDKQWRETEFINYRKDIRDKIVQLLPPNEAMLDVGCGNSVLYDHLPQELKPNYVGVDFTPEFIELCKKRHPDGDWRVEDARNLSFPDNSFYLVNSTTLLQHIPEWKKAARELVRVSKRYVVSTCRTHPEETRVVSAEPVLRRRFNPEDIINFYRQYGTVTHQPADGIFDTRQIMGIFTLEKQR